MRYAAAVWISGVVLAACPSSSEAQILSQEAACKLTHEDATVEGKVYTIKGTYSWDFEWGSNLEPDGCDLGFLAPMDGEAAAKRSQYLDAFGAKCHGSLQSFTISGVFTGTYVRDKEPHDVTFAGRTVSSTNARFIVADVQAPELDPASISCPK